MSYIIGSSTQEKEKTFVPCNRSPAELLWDPKIRDPWSVGQALDLLKRDHPQTRIGFTNGTFKLLTPAHSVFLNLCKTRCDILVVGLNSDYSLRLLKKKSPFSDKERAFMLSQYEVVNYVCLFDEETPADLILKLGVDVVFKGYDYKDQEVVSAGKSVEILDHPFSVHTSDILKTKDSKFKYFQVPE